MRALAVALIAGLFLSGCAKISCAKNDRFDPEGNDAHIYGSWTIDGEKGTAENCNAPGTVDGGLGSITISQIEIIIWNTDETEPWISNRLRVDCDVGNSIDSRTDSNGEPNTKLKADLLLRAGSYKVQWVAVSANGDVIDCKPLVDLEIPDKDAADAGVDAGVSLRPDPPPTVMLAPVDLKLNANCETCPCS